MTSKLRRKSLGGPSENGGATARGEAMPLLSPRPPQGVQEDLGGGLDASIKKRDIFGDHRWRCILNSTRAVQTLDHWARLDLSIVQALDLIDPADTYFVDSNANPSVMVFSDDMFVYETQTLSGQNPNWNHSGYLNIIAPQTMVRIHVRHKAGGKSDTGIGFVEFNVGDIPFDEDIEGWFELRFEDRLLLTSKARYSEHCKRKDADDEAYELKESERAETPREAEGGITRSSSSGYLAKKLRKHSAMGLCCRGNSGDQYSDHGDEEFRRNAGEIYLRLKLTHTGSGLDGVFALALNPTPPVHFGIFLSPDEPGTRDVQGMYDEAIEVKMAVWDDAFLSTQAYVNFILQWRHILLSALIWLLFVLSCSNEWIQGPCLLLSMAVLMCVNAREELRLKMTTCGGNAPLTDNGFKHVAAMADEKQMFSFLQRTIENKLGSTLSGESGHLKMLSQRCFRDGVPVLDYEDLKTKLKMVKWIKKGQEIAVGSLVMVRERHTAVVKALHGTAEVEVKYDKAAEGPGPDNRFSRSRERLQEVVPIEDVQMRPKIWDIPSGLVPDGIQAKVKRFRVGVDEVKLRLVPTIRKVGDVLTWKKARQARILSWACLLASLTSFIFSEWYRMCGNTNIRRGPIQIWLKDTLNIRCGSQHQWHEYERGLWLFHFMVAFVLDHGSSTIILLAGSFVLLMKAGWLMPLRAIFRIFHRSLTLKRKAPKKWSFFRKGLGGEEEPAATSYSRLTQARQGVVQV